MKFPNSMDESLLPPVPASEKPSKTQRKRDMLERQKLGEQLLNLPERQLNALPLAPRLYEALVDAKTIRSREGQRRQLQYVGRLMRTADTDAIEKQLLLWQHGHSPDDTSPTIQAAEKLANTLLAHDDALTQLLERYPHTEVQPLRQLLRTIRRRQHPGPPRGEAWERLVKQLSSLIQSDDQPL